MSAEAEQYGSEMRSSKGEISELNRMISRLQNEIQAVKAQVSDRFTEWEVKGNMHMLFFCRIFACIEP